MKLALIIAIALAFSGCGFLDQDIHLTDEELEYGIGGIGMSGSSTSGCGFGYGRVHSSGIHIHGVAGLAQVHKVGEERGLAQGEVDSEERSQARRVEQETKLPSTLQVVAQEVLEKRQLSAANHLEPESDTD